MPCEPADSWLLGESPTRTTKQLATRPAPLLLLVPTRGSGMGAAPAPHGGPRAGWGVAGAAGPPCVPSVSWRCRLARQKQAVIIPSWQVTGLRPGFTGQNVFSTSAREWLCFPFFNCLQIYKFAGCFPLLTFGAP